MPLMIPQPQYRPWESKQKLFHFLEHIQLQYFQYVPKNGDLISGPHDIKSGLPSFQSQFGEEMVTTLTTLTPAACSPAPSVPSPGLPSFHTLSAVNPRYPLVPAPVQAREIPSIQQQFLDERHIHLFQGAPGQNFSLQPQNGTLTSLNNGTTLTTLNNAQYHLNNAQILPGGQIIGHQGHILGPNSQIISNGHIISSSGVVSQNSSPTVLTVVKAEPVNIVELKSSNHRKYFALPDIFFKFRQRFRLRNRLIPLCSILILLELFQIIPDYHKSTTTPNFTIPCYLKVIIWIPNFVWIVLQEALTGGKRRGEKYGLPVWKVRTKVM